MLLCCPFIKKRESNRIIGVVLVGFCFVLNLGTFTKVQKAAVGKMLRGPA